MNFDPVQVGQAVAGVVLMAVTCVAAVRKGLERWSSQQEVAAAKERKRRSKAEQKSLRTVVRAVLLEELNGFNARLERLETDLKELVSRKPARTRGKDARP